MVRFTEREPGRRDITNDMWRVVAALSDGGRQRQIDLAGTTSIEASTMSRLVTRLVRRRLVDRSRSRMNGREVTIELTSSGKHLVDQLIPIALAVERSAIGTMGARDLIRMKQALRSMYASLQSPNPRAAAARNSGRSRPLIVQKANVFIRRPPGGGRGRAHRADD